MFYSNKIPLNIYSNIDDVHDTFWSMKEFYQLDLFFHFNFGRMASGGKTAEISEFYFE